jgi:IPT/TIG domain
VLAAAHALFWQTPSWNWAEFWALLVLLGVSLFPIRVPKKRSELNGSNGATKWGVVFVSLVNGKDGRWSTSKTSAVLWTYAVWFAFLTILLHTNGKGLEHAILKQQYLVLLGVPVASAVIAKGFTQSKVESGKLATKAPDGVETDVVSGLGQLVADDTGQPALADFQYFGFNVLLLAYFFVRFLGDQAAGLPDLPDSLVALTGVSAAGYVAKKGVTDDTTTPVITSIDPPAAALGDTIAIRGPNLATVNEQNVAVQIGNASPPILAISIGEYDATITVRVPPDGSTGEAAVRVVNYKGVTTNPYPYTITAPPPPAAPAGPGG